jgi:hypothetical protein
MMPGGLEVLGGGGGVTPVGLNGELEDDRKTNLIVNYLPQTMTQVVSHPFTFFILLQTVSNSWSSLF